MKKEYICAAVAAFFVSTSCFATPVISGKYLFTANVSCQPTLTVNILASTNDGNIVNSVALGPSSVQMTMLLVTFNSNKLKASYSGFGDSGSLALFKSTGAVQFTQGDPVQEMPGSGNTTYSNSDTTFTLGGVAFNVLYGQVDKNNIVHYLTAQSVHGGENGTTCMEQDIASRQ